MRLRLYRVVAGFTPPSAMNWAMRCSSTGRGTEPSARITSWNFRWSNARPELFLGFTAVPADLQLAELVGEGLSGPGDVAFDLGGDLVLGERGVGAQVVHRLLAAPAELMDARCRSPGGTRATSRT